MLDSTTTIFCFLFIFDQGMRGMGDGRKMSLKATISSYALRWPGVCARLEKKIHGPAEAYWVTARFTIAYVVIFISSPGFYSVEFSGAVPSFLLFL